MRTTIPAVLLSLLAAGMGPPPAAAADALPVEEIERIVKDYLLREPEVIYQAIQELQRRQQAEAATRQQEAIAANAPDIFRHARDPVGGNVDSRTTLVEFFDYRCGYCRNMAGQLREMVASDGDLRFVFKELPVLGPESLVAAKAALAASRLDRARYVDFHFALMQSKELTEEAILELAGRHGFDATVLRREMAAPWVEDHIQETRALADKLGITGTPSFVIGDTLIPGAVAVAELAAKVAEERGRAN